MKTLTPFYDALVDTQAATGSDFYQGALMFYASAQYGAKTGIPSAGSVYDDLATRFPSRTAKKRS